MPPKIAHRKDLMSLSEDFEFVDGEHKFLRTVWAVLDDVDVAWKGQKNVRKFYISLPEFEAALEPVPDDWLFPEMSREFTTAPDDGVGERLYIKRPNITRYDPDIVAMLCHQYPGSFWTRSESWNFSSNTRTRTLCGTTAVASDESENDEELQTSLDKDSIMADIEAAVAHLHSLGLAHNDFNPSNVVIGKKKEAILIDFGSCQPFGKELLSTGTPGWIDEDFTTSEQNHDWVALPKIRTWLDDVYQGLPTDLPPMFLDGLGRSTRSERGLL